MSHKILFLGTAGDIKTAGKLRSAGGIVVNTEGYQIHLDPGPGALESAKVMKLNLRETQVIVATNNSLINTGEVSAVADYMTYEGLDGHGVLIGAISVINGSNEENPVLKESSRKYLEKVIGLRADDKVGLGDVNIHAIKIQSKDESGIGIMIESPVFKMGYLPECGFSVKTCKALEGVDILILSIKNPKNEEVPKSLNLSEAEKVVTLVKPRLVVITGLGYKLAAGNPIDIIRDIQKTTKIQTMVASDGMVLNASSYKSVKQEKLD
jgi:hypothetical protein